MENTLKETYGVIVYQEQVMEIAKVLAGYSLGAADLLRRAMGKKIQSEMDEEERAYREFEEMIDDFKKEYGVLPGKGSFILTNYSANNFEILFHDYGVVLIKN